MALVNQQAQAAGNPNVGFINPAIYSIGANANYSSDFNDISSGNNDCCGLTLSYNAVNGYDLVTGWGSAKGQSLIDALAGPLPGPVMTLAASPNFLTTYPGASGTSTIIVNSLGGFSGSVNLTISGLPNGVTASLSTNPHGGRQFTDDYREQHCCARQLLTYHHRDLWSYNRDDSSCPYHRPARLQPSCLVWHDADFSGLTQYKYRHSDCIGGFHWERKFVRVWPSWRCHRVF